MKTSTFEFPHERDPLFLAATKFYALVTKIDPQPGSVAMRRRLESAAAQIFLSIQEAIDFSDLRTKRLGIALRSCARATGILKAMNRSGFLDEKTHLSAHQVLRAISIELDPSQGEPPTAAALTDEELAGGVTGPSSAAGATGDGEGRPTETPSAESSLSVDS